MPIATNQRSGSLKKLETDNCFLERVQGSFKKELLLVVCVLISLLSFVSNSQNTIDHWDKAICIFITGSEPLS